jgi:hypothetical protein
VKCSHSVAARAGDSERSASLELALMADWRPRDTLSHGRASTIAAIAVACGAALFLALMAWAGQHQS